MEFVPYGPVWANGILSFGHEEFVQSIWCIIRGCSWQNACLISFRQFMGNREFGALMHWLAIEQVLKITLTVLCYLSKSYLLQPIHKKAFTSTARFFRLSEDFMLRKQGGLPEVLYQNVIIYPFNRDHLFFKHFFFLRNATLSWRVSWFYSRLMAVFKRLAEFTAK